MFSFETTGRNSEVKQTDVRKTGKTRVGVSKPGQKNKREENQCKQGWLCKMINKIDKPTARLTKKKNKRTQIKNGSKNWPLLTFCIEIKEL